MDEDKLDDELEICYVDVQEACLCILYDGICDARHDTDYSFFLAILF